MTAELRDAGGKRGQDPDERVRRDATGKRCPLRGLPVELSTVVHVRRAVPQRNVHPTSEVEQDRARRLIAMDVLVGVDVGGIRAGEASELCELTGKLVAHRLRVVGGNHLVEGNPSPVSVGPLAQVDVESDAQRRMFASVGGGLLRGGPAHHQAGASDDTLLVSSDDAAIDAWTLAE